MKRVILAAGLLLALPAAASATQEAPPIEAATADRAQQIEQVLAGEKEAGQVFAPSFLAAVPAAQLEALTAQLVAQNGAVVGVENVQYRGNGAASFTLLFEKARGDASLQLSGEAPYLVTGFRITNVTPLDDSPEKIQADFAALPGDAAFGVYRLGAEGPEPVLAGKGGEELAIGSTFKLYVLSALAQEIKAGQRHWSDVTTLDAHSLPSGQMQDWPLGTPVTLQTLATMMISVSDNTATDTLIRLLGRPAIEREVAASGHADPSRNAPFLSTVEVFALKAGDPARIAAYAAADDAGQRALLQQWAPEMTADHVDVARLMGAPPIAIDSVEWFASPEDIARILARLRDTGDPVVRAILAVSPSVSPEESANWAYVGYKGGSEPGVLSYSWLLEDKKDEWYAVTLSWNDPDKEVDATRLQLLAVRLLGLLHK